MAVGLAIFVRLQAWSARIAYTLLGASLGVVACGYMGWAGSKTGPELLVTVIGAAFPVAAAIAISNHQELKKRAHQAGVLWAGVRHVERALIDLDGRLAPAKDLIHPRDADGIWSSLGAVSERFQKFTQFSVPLNDPDVSAEWRDAFQDAFDSFQTVLGYRNIGAEAARAHFQTAFVRGSLHRDVQAAFEAINRYRKALGRPVM